MVGTNTDVVYGDSGNDLLYGGTFGGTVYGGEGNDTIFVGFVDTLTAVEVVYGGEGNDEFTFGTSNVIVSGSTSAAITVNVISDFDAALIRSVCIRSLPLQSPRPSVIRHSLRLRPRMKFSGRADGTDTKSHDRR